MNCIFTAPRLGAACLIVGLAAGAAALWASQQGPAPATTPLAEDEPAARLLDELPAPKAPRVSDAEVARWTARARLAEKDPASWAGLGEALMQKARETADASYYGHAERAFHKALALDGNHGDAVTGMAWVESCRHEFEKSVVWAEKALALDDRNHRACGLLGDAAAEMGDYDTAVRHYQRMLDIRPDVSSYSRGAHLVFVLGDTRRGLFMMRKALESGAPYAEHRAWCLAQLATMSFETGNLVAAEGTLAEAKGTAADSPHVLAARGRLKAARGDHAGAIACYRKAADAAPQLDVLAPLVDLYRLTGDTAEAERTAELIEKVHELNKANGVRGDARMGLFYADQGRRLDEAARMAEEEYKTRKSVHVADAVAWCRFKAGRTEEAREAARQALRKGTPDARFLFHSGMIHAKLGDRATAQKHLYQALSLNPHFHPTQAKEAADTLEALGSKRPEEGGRPGGAS